MTSKSTSKQEPDVKQSTPLIPRCVVVFCFAAFIRVAFKVLFQNALMRRVELVSPLTSWFRMNECVALSQVDILPYAGDICHHPPIVIYFFQHICKSYPWFLFISADLLISIVLYSTARTFIETQLDTQSREKSSYAANTDVLLFNERQLKHIPITVMCFYLFNPCVILTCHAQSTEVINNLAMSLVLFSMVKRWYAVACLFISLSAYLSLYPIMLLVPVLLHVFYNSSSKFYDVLKYIMLTVFYSCCLMLSSYRIYYSWSFVYAVYGFILQAPDLTPNMGLFWYFFAEMFDHFRLFFLWVYQINVFIYLVPIAIIFRKHQMLVCYVLLSIMSLFKSYSNVGSLALPFALLPLWSYTFRYLKNVLLVSAFLCVSLLLAPGMWYLWIYAGSGNVNFFYAVTLAYATGQVFLLSDILYAFMRHEYHLKHGVVVKTEDGKVGTPVLK